jgi:hypothetical protein
VSARSRAAPWFRTPGERLELAVDAYRAQRARAGFVHPYYFAPSVTIDADRVVFRAVPPEEDPRPMSHPARYCNGGPHGHGWCGKTATVVCTMRNDGPNPLQWFACDDVDHQEQAITTPIAEWFAKLFPDGDAPEPIVD